MKITIESKNERISVNVDAPNGTSRADIAKTLSIALASTVASAIPADAPYPARLAAGAALSEKIANAVKQNFLEVVTGECGKAAVFTGKEAEFLAKLMGL